MTPRPCGNDPTVTLTPGDQAAVDEFRAYLVDRQFKPKIVCICGSMRFQTDMAEAAAAESLAGRIVVMPHVNAKLWADTELNAARKVQLDQLHRAKIRMATGGILVVGSYVGESTTAEIRYARYLGIPVRFTHPDVDPGPEAGQ